MRKHTALVTLCVCPFAALAGEPEGLRERFVNRIKSDLERVSDFVCLQTSDRFRRSDAGSAWQKIDTVRFEVALVGHQELYSLPGARRFEHRPLGSLVRNGSVSTGQLALLAKHVFDSSDDHFTYRGESEHNGRRAYEYGYDIPAAQSHYHLRLGTSDEIVGFQGNFWIDAETFDLLRLEVQAYDIPDSLGLLQADTALDYARVPLNDVETLLPHLATLSIAAANGDENMNRASFSGCKRYQSESTIRFDTTEAASTGSSDRIVPRELPTIPAGTLLELNLETNVDPSSARVGDTITATLTRALRNGDQIIVPQGSPVAGRIVRIDKGDLTAGRYQVGFQFDSIQLEGQTIPLVATMLDAGPAGGLLRQSKKLDPTFTARGPNHIAMLVREVQNGQGILDWDAKKTPIPRGLRMRWRVVEK